MDDFMMDEEIAATTCNTAPPLPFEDDWFQDPRQPEDTDADAQDSATEQDRAPSPVDPSAPSSPIAVPAGTSDWSDWW
jgi:hypothetical protein